MEVLGPPGHPTPAVRATRRPANSPPELVEIVLDRPLSPGVTTRFTFNDGAAAQAVEYTLNLTGTCCDAATCLDGDILNCTGDFVASQTCTVPRPCCHPSGACELLDPLCCAARGGIEVPAAEECEGDLDGDGTDGLCGDECPTDPDKLSPGVCSCHNPDTDADTDGVADCVDECPADAGKITPGACGCGIPDSDSDGVSDCRNACPGVDDTFFAPDCATAIPAAGSWGLIVLTLLLLTAGKICPRPPDFAPA